MTWTVCQLGARENYAVARALERQGVLDSLITDIWTPPTFPARRALGRIGERSHPQLAKKVWAPTVNAIAREFLDKSAKRTGWLKILDRNAWFQRMAADRLACVPQKEMTVFAYSYAAADIFALAKQKGWRTVLGQIDPGPVEARMVEALYAKAAQPHVPIPKIYWENWWRETELADTIVVNSDWSREGLIEEGVAADKIAVVPLATETEMTPVPWTVPSRFESVRPLKLLFLGQVTLRKGIDIALKALRRLPELPLQLDVVGPLQITVPEWSRADERIRFHGRVARSAVADAYAKADLFLFPTRSDGFGLTQLEAQAAGVPVIASRHCGRVVENGVNGLIVDPLDADTLADVLRSLVEDPNLVSTLRQGTGLAPQHSLDGLGEALLAAQKHVSSCLRGARTVRQNPSQI